VENKEKQDFGGGGYECNLKLGHRSFLLRLVGQIEFENVFMSCID
jgi:hypothetical protein